MCDSGPAVVIRNIWLLAGMIMSQIFGQNKYVMLVNYFTC